jgi:protocadherin Fat 1/2/3
MCARTHTIAAALRIVVDDVNDNPPIFEQTEYNVDLSEDAQIGHSVVRVLARSDDVGENAQVHYHLIGGDEILRTFQLDMSTGQLTLIAPVDYDTHATKIYAFDIDAVDLGEPPLSTRAHVVVHLLDANDNSPKFERPQYDAKVIENAPPGTSLAQVRAVDADAGEFGRVHYRFYKQQDGKTTKLFSIDAQSGAVTVAGRIDRESESAHQILIDACDSANMSRCDTTVVKVTVLDVNDNAPMFDICNLTASVQEGAPIGHVLLTAVVTDLDGDTNAGPFKFTLAGEGHQLFSVDQLGVVRTGQQLRYEQRALYLLTLTAIDAGQPPKQSECPVTVKVVEESKHAPVVSGMSIAINAYLAEFPGGMLTTVHATDRDKRDVLTYRLVPTGTRVCVLYLDSTVFAGDESTDAYFKMDATNGTLWGLMGLPAQRHTLNVSVTDGKYSAFAKYTVNVNVITEDVLEYALSMRVKGALGLCTPHIPRSQASHQPSLSPHTIHSSRRLLPKYSILMRVTCV